jgi:putative membrane protein
MKKCSLAVLALGLAGLSSLSAQPSIPHSDMAFAEKAGAGGESEVELGKLAGTKAANQKVREFGERMARDHEKGCGELKSLATRKGIMVPDTADAEGKALLARLSSMSGKEFDRAYMEAMVGDHEKDVAEFKKEAESGSDPDLKKWAFETLPTLEEHLRIARETLKSLE